MSAHAAVTPFAITDALPAGRVTLEASAGTGKTYSIVGLATRFLAEGRCRADELLVVTFARSATRELRSRLLERLDDALSLLEGIIAGATAPAADDVDADRVAVALCTLDPDVPGGARAAADATELRRRRDRLTDALADIDQATVSTIHAFCGEALDRLGDSGRGELLEDEQAFAIDIAADLYLRAGEDDPRAADQLPYFDMVAPPLARAGLVTDPADVIPAPALTSWDGARAWLVTETHRESLRRKRRARVHTHDDLLRRLADRLADHAHGADAADRAGGHFRVALVDEFQDTDPVQWRIVSQLFPDVTGVDGRTLVLVGDPKQAIYAFRGADVNAYVQARGPQARHHLDVNRRSDDSVVRAVQALFVGQPLGRGIDVPPVRAAAGDRLTGLDTAPVTVAVVADDAPVRRTQRGHMQRTGLRDVVARDVAGQTARLLTCGAQLNTAPAAAAGADGSRPLVPADIAVLVRTRRQAALVQHHLTEAGVPSVRNGVGNVMGSPAARDWSHLLRALDRPSQSGLARLAALSDLIGWPPTDVATADDDRWDRLHIALHDWRQVLLTAGVAAAFRQLGADTQLRTRLLGRTDGARRLTDLTHVAELLHAHHSSHVIGTAGLVAWLAAGVAEATEATRPVPPDHLASRLEHGGDAVQIMTVHGAKGLEFGVVLAPYLWDVVGRNPVTMPFHDHTTGRRRLYVGTNRRDPDHDHRKAMYTQEADDEERRLAYVAATRARHHLRLWWAPAEHVAESPLGTLLARPQRVHTSVQAVEAIRGLQAATPDLFGLVEVAVGAAHPSSPAVAAAPEGLSLARFDRDIDAGWRRTSYSRLVNDAHTAADAVGGAIDVDTRPAGRADGGLDEEGYGGAAAEAGDLIVPSAVPDADLELAVEVPLGPLGGGADFGSALHAVLEHIDFADPDLPSALQRHVARQIHRHAVDVGGDEGEALIVEGLTAALHTPLWAGGPALRQVSPRHRIDELAFELPVLAEGLASAPDRVLLGDIADLLDAHLPTDDPLSGYGAVLRTSLGDIEVRGFLAGFIDLVARVPNTDGYLVADYKTNRMAPAGTDSVTLAHFTPAAMAAEMQTHHYPLQALMYLVAVHRYLRWRIRDYDPDTHLAGVAYLFLRGMVGADTPERDAMTLGVFRWRPPTSLLLALDGLIASGVNPSTRRPDGLPASGAETSIRRPGGGGA